MMHDGSLETVCWLLTGNEGYGVQETTVEFAAAMNRFDVDTPAVALTDGPITQRLDDQDHATHILDVDPPRSLDGNRVEKTLGFVDNRLRTRHAKGPLQDVLTDIRPDVLLVQNRTLVSTAGQAANQAGCKPVWRMADMGANYPLELNTRYLENLCRRYKILPIGNSRHTSLALSGTDVPPHVYLGVDEATFQPDTVVPIPRAELSIPPDAIIVGIVARLHPTKGQRELVEAIGQLETDQAVHLVILGGPPDGSYAWTLRERARDLGIEDRVHLVGRVEDPERYYATCDVIVNARVDPEPFGRTVVEAMMMETPVLAHAPGGPGEVIVDGRTGWLVYAPTPNALMHGLQRAIRDEARWDEMGQRARAYALERFHLDNQVDQFLDIIHGSIHGTWGFEAP